MRISVDGLHLRGYGVELLLQADLEERPCPICGTANHEQLIGVVTGLDASSSVESAFCRLCRHRYHRKSPGSEWLHRYYRDRYEAGTSVPRLPPLTSVRKRVADQLRFGRSGAPDRVYDFAVGVLKGDRTYFTPSADVRRVLEIGCGYGASLARLRDAGFDVVGVEATAARVKYCRRNGLDVRLASDSSLSQVRDAGPFDFVYTKHVIEHIVDVHDHMRNIVWVMRQGAFLYVETPDLSGEIHFHHSHLLQHVHAFSLHSLLALLAHHGFRPVRVLQDVNLQVLAVLTDRVEIPEAPLGDYPLALVPYMEVFRSNAERDVRVEWDNYRVRLSSLQEGRTLYNDQISPLSVKDSGARNVMTVRPSETGRQWPIEYHYGSYERPPIWVKK